MSFNALTRLTAAELRMLYVDENKGCPEIARLVGCDPTTIHHWLRDAGIPTRRRGSNPAVYFRKGERSAFAGRRHTPEAIAKVRASTVADGRVPYLRNGRHFLSGARPEDNPNWKGGLTPERQAFYRSDEWKLACVEVWHRADARCERCGFDHRDQRERNGERFHVHHIVTFQYPPLRAEPSNLVLLCPDCHRHVHSKENVSGEFIRPRPDLDDQVPTPRQAAE